MSWAGDMVSNALDALGIESLEDKIAAQTQQDINEDDYMGSAYQDASDAEHIASGGIIDSQGHRWSGSGPVYDTSFLTDTNDIAGLASRVKAMYSDEGNFWDDEEAYLGDVMRDYERDYFPADDRDDSPIIYQCEQAGGTWVNGACVMPEDDPSDDDEKELDDFINSFDPFTSIKRAKWIHPLAGYGTSNLWDYKPPQFDDWTPELRSWAAGE